MKYGKRKIWKVLNFFANRRKKPEKAEKTEDQYIGRVELTNELIFRKVDRLVREKKLYRQPDLTMEDVAQMLGTNRTYVSRAMQCYAGGFMKYMRNLKVEYLHAYIIEVNEEGRLLEDGEDLAMKAGFVNKRAMQRAVKLTDGESLYEFNKRCRESEK